MWDTEHPGVQIDTTDAPQGRYWLVCAACGGSRPYRGIPEPGEICEFAQQHQDCGGEPDPGDWQAEAVEIWSDDDQDTADLLDAL
jgi:hypothetical protein